GSATKTTDRKVLGINILTTDDTGDAAEQPGVFWPRVGGGFHRLMTVEISGDGFLRHMVRIIVGSLVEIGRGRRDAVWLGRALASGDRRMAGPTAPAHGLFLLGVDYPSDVLADEC